MPDNSFDPSSDQEPDQRNVPQRIESIEDLVREIEGLPDPAARAACTHLVQTLMEFHGSGIERILEVVHRSGEVGQQIIDDLGDDDLASSLLLLHDLHPLDLPSRVLRALEKTRPYLQSHGGNVELVGVTGSGAVTIRLVGSCHSCPSSAVTLQSTVEQAIYAAAPDVTAIHVEAGAAVPAASTSGFVPLAALQSKHIPPSVEAPVMISASERSAL
jgi:Fe-S cluster biogenesis protein NfuA